MTLFNRRVVPLWVLEHQKRQRDISTLLTFLEESPGDDIISEEEMEGCIEVNSLDYDTGTTASTSNTTPYFGRRFDLRLPRASRFFKAQHRLQEAEGLRQSKKDYKVCDEVAHEIDFQIGRHIEELDIDNKAPYELQNIKYACSLAHKIDYHFILTFNTVMTPPTAGN